MAADRYEVQPDPHVLIELEKSPIPFNDLVKEASGFFENGDADVDDLAVARSYIERGYSEDLAYWLVREVNVRRAAGGKYLA